MRRLLILRHAEAAADPGVPDHERPLTDRGRRDASRMGRWLCDQGLLPDVALVSTAARAQETARRVLDTAGYSGRIRTEREAYLASWRTLLRLAEERREDTVLVVGHNPGLEGLVCRLASGPVESTDGQIFPTASLAVLDRPEGDPVGRCTLKHLVRSKELR